MVGGGAYIPKGLSSVVLFSGAYSREALYSGALIFGGLIFTFQNRSFVYIYIYIYIYYIEHLTGNQKVRFPIGTQTFF